MGWRQVAPEQTCFCCSAPADTTNTERSQRYFWLKAAWTTQVDHLRTQTRMRAFLCLCHKQIFSLPQSRTNVAIANVPAVSCDVSVFSFAMYWEDTADVGGSSLRQAFSTRLPRLVGSGLCLCVTWSIFKPGVHQPEHLFSGWTALECLLSMQFLSFTLFLAS